MKHTLRWVILCFIFVISFSNISYAKSQPMQIQVNNKTRTVHSASVEVNGFSLHSKFSPYIDQNRTFVPIREITELMGAKVEWNQKTKSINVQLRNTNVKLKIDSNIVYIDGKKTVVSNDSIPRLAFYKTSQGETKTMVPLRFLSESFGFTVDWKQNQRLASISNGEVTAPNLEPIDIQPVPEPVKPKPQPIVDPKPTVEPKPAPIVDNPEKINVGAEPSNRIVPAEKVGPLTVVIDPGHGGKDGGATAIDKQKEKDLNLQVANKLVPLLKSKGYEVIMTRSRDEFIGLYERANIANNAQAEVFLSIHFNSASSEKAHGIEVLYASEDDVEIKTTEQKILAEEVLKALIKETGAYSRGVKNRPDLAVLRRTDMTAALVELGFLSNVEDVKDINSSGYLDKLARGLFKGIENYENKYLK